MATYTTSIEKALAIAGRLARANVPFTLTYEKGRGTISCKFQETLNAAIDFTENAE